MIRLGVDARPLCHPTTGIGQYTTRILEQFAQAPDLELHLFSRDGWHTNTFGGHVRTAKGLALPNFVHAGILFSQWARADQLDVFWSPRHHLPWRLQCPSVVTIHDMVWLKHPATMTRGGALLERMMMPRALREAQAVICVSASTYNDVSDFDPAIADKGTVIHEAACIEPIAGAEATRPEAIGDKPYFLFVGTKEPRKNLDRCLLAWRDSGLQQRGYKLVVAGGDGWKYRLRESIRRYGIDTSVVDLMPSTDELRQLYAQCRAVILPSLYEGFGLPLVEAMRFGKPMITSNVSSMPEIAGDAALLVNPKVTAELSAAFVRLAQDEAMHEKLSSNSAARSKLFSWEKAGQATLEVILNAARSGGNRNT